MQTVERTLAVRLIMPVSVMMALPTVTATTTMAVNQIVNVKTVAAAMTVAVVEMMEEEMTVETSAKMIRIVEITHTVRQAVPVRVIRITVTVTTIITMAVRLAVLVHHDNRVPAQELETVMKQKTVSMAVVPVSLVCMTAMETEPMDVRRMLPAQMAMRP
jgi:hypothetical protein